MMVRVANDCDADLAESSSHIVMIHFNEMSRTAWVSAHFKLFALTEEYARDT